MPTTSGYRVYVFMLKLKDCEKILYMLYTNSDRSIPGLDYGSQHLFTDESFQIRFVQRACFF